MTTKELFNEPGTTCGTRKIMGQEQRKIARYQIPHGPSALLVILLDLLLRLDPR
jgi:hypothetical protein